MAINIIDVVQGSPEWFAARAGIPTASMFSAILAKGEGKTRRTYMYKLLGERLTGEPAENYTNAHMERGKEMEDTARNTYALIHNVDPVRIGFVRNGRVGASPDAFIDNNGLSEFKTKLPHLLLEILMTGEMPSEHVAQVQGQLWIAEREWCDFVAYWPKLKIFVKRVYRDEKYIASLSASVHRFCEELDELQGKYEAAA